MESIKINLIFILFIQLFELFNFENSTSCEYGHFLTPCDIHNKMNGKFYNQIIILLLQVLYYWKPNSANCNDNLLPASKIAVSCDKSCGKGYFLNMLLDSPECTICPENTFSLGGSLRINGNLKEWTNDVLSLFEINCSYQELDIWKKNSNCKGFKISDDKSHIEAGTEVDKYDSVYFFELSYGVHLKQAGNVNNIIILILIFV